MVFTGYYEHSIDDKNRLAIPAKFRSRWNDDRDGTGWVIVPGRPAGTLWLYPERHFERLVGQGDSELIPNADQLGFDQTFFPLAEHVELDKHSYTRADVAAIGSRTGGHHLRRARSPRSQTPRRL
jgi:DNA-binding transcriptional regulator/RsmH inhibitor MraZ